MTYCRLYLVPQIDGDTMPVPFFIICPAARSVKTETSLVARLNTHREIRTKRRRLTRLESVVYIAHALANNRFCVFSMFVLLRFYIFGSPVILIKISLCYTPRERSECFRYLSVTYIRFLVFEIVCANRFERNNNAIIDLRKRWARLCVICSATLMSSTVYRVILYILRYQT